jgi:hypothetical protein
VKDKLLPHQGHTFAASSIGQSVFVLQAEPNPGWIQVPRKTGLPLQHEAILSPRSASKENVTIMVSLAQKKMLPNKFP